MRLSLEPSPLGSAAALLMVGLVILDMPVMATLLSLAAMTGACLMDQTIL